MYLHSPDFPRPPRPIFHEMIPVVVGSVFFLFPLYTQVARLPLVLILVVVTSTSTIPRIRIPNTDHTTFIPAKDKHARRIRMNGERIDTFGRYFGSAEKGGCAVRVAEGCFCCGGCGGGGGVGVVRGVAGGGGWSCVWFGGDGSEERGLSPCRKGLATWHV